MPDFINQLTTCSDLPSCFQMLYNLLLVILVGLSFLYGIYGALEYLFSAASVTKKESGKNKIINAIGAILIAFILPSILNVINPGIFQVRWLFPVIEEARTPQVEFNGANAGYATVDEQKPPPYIGYIGRGQVSSFNCDGGVPLIKQTDPNYRNIRYGNGFIGPSGCGLVSLVMAKAWCEGWCNDGISNSEKERVSDLLTKLVNLAVREGGGYRGTPKTFIEKYGNQINKYEDIQGGKVYIWNIRDSVYVNGHYLIIAGTIQQCNVRGKVYENCLLLKDPADGNYRVTPKSQLGLRTQIFKGKPAIWEVDCAKLNF